MVGTDFYDDVTWKDNRKRFYIHLRIFVDKNECFVMSVSKTTYLPLANGQNNKGNPLIGVEYSLLNQ